MVLLKELSEGIWGLALGPNSTSEVVTDLPFRLTMAALEVDDVEGSESTSNGITRVTIKSNTADKGPATDLILCNLHYPSCLQQPLDIEFYDGQTLSFGVKGPHKVHLTGYVLQPESHEMCEEGHLPVGKSREFFETEDASSSEDDDDDDEDDDDDDDDESDDEGALQFARRHRLRDDEDQDLEGDYEDGYVEGEDQLNSDTSSSSDSDNDQPQKVSALSNKNKKRPHPEANGHSIKQEPETKKLKKNKNNEEETTKTNDNESKKTKKSAKKAPTTSANDTNPTSTTADNKKTSNSLEINDIRVGTGPEAKLGKTAAVYYTGRLKSNNVMFDSCIKGKPFRFRLGAGEVIRGWDQGVKGMRVGGKRRLIIPPSLAYGSQKLPDIPANSTLIFDIELKNVF